MQEATDEIQATHRAWLAAARDGDEAAFARLVEVFAGRLLRLYQRMGVSDAEDLVQDTFVRMHQRLGSYRPTFAVSTWLFTIGRRMAIDRLRRRNPPLPLDDLDARASEASVHLPGDDLWEAARGLLAPRTFQLLWLHYGEGERLADAARILRITPLHARVLLHRARRQLANAWQDLKGRRP